MMVQESVISWMSTFLTKEIHKSNWTEGYIDVSIG